MTWRSRQRELPRRRRRAGSADLLASSACAREDEANIRHRTGAPSRRLTAGAASLLRGQVLKDQGILGRDEIAERHLVKRKLPEERENPVVVDLRSAWQANLLNFPAAGAADRVADLPNQSLLGVAFEARWDGERADRAHGYVLDPAVLAHRFVRPFSDQNTRVRNRPCFVNLFVQLLKDLLLGAVIHASRDVDGRDGHLFLLSWSLALLTFGQPLVGPVPAGEPPGGEGRGAVWRGDGTGLDGRERDTLASDEGELLGTPGVVVRNDLLIAPGHHVVGPPVEELGGVHDEEPWLALLGLGGEQRHRVSGLRLGGVLGGGQPLEFERVPLVIVDEHAVFRSRDFGRHFAIPFDCQGRVTQIERGRIE